MNLRILQNPNSMFPRQLGAAMAPEQIRDLSESERLETLNQIILKIV